MIICLYIFIILSSTRGGTVVSSLAVSRLLLVFDYMVHLLSGERNSSHFKKLLEQVRTVYPQAHVCNISYPKG